ncbi:Trypanosome variant surface glycoprotein (A-type)/Trypanosome variant surface glycoprotein C-terminal domain containing protein, putative [Trypanosoma equiperdum]|uniref:Trypanosome variant surface glycoprotein (A-type)/Trypanosome variant surface glycoprotein C-terminal domain containing protein, putative n=1 Tax=Trypanosoma equiperdum TaxID=5694 RepID=A0A1G4IKJ5_TRYEQ|nr:Trypanosome variant surface glycoprotein (A-type)/Trypanosome variant surface glycoprotein C-terminal domain containing protein, putative [Trypanosoma equiperdum]
MHFAIFLLAPLYATVLASHEALKETHWGPVCELGGELNKLPGAARAKLKALRSAEQAARMTALQLNVYAAMQKNNKSAAAIGALAAAVEIQAHTARTALDAKTSEFIRAAATTAHFAGAVGEAINFLDKIAGTGGSYYCLGNGDASTAGRNQIAAGGCVVSSWKYEAMDTNLKEKTYDATSFPKLKQISGSSAKGGTTSKCGLFQFGADQNTPIISGTRPEMAAGLILATASDTISVTTVGDLTTANRESESNRLKAVHHDTKTIADFTTSEYKTEPEKIIEAAITTKKAEDMLKQILKATYSPEHSQQAEAAAVEIAKAIYKPDDDKGKSIWNGLKAAKPRTVAGDDSKQAELHTISDEDTLHRLLAYYTQSALDNVAAKELELHKLKNELADQKGKSPEAECNKISDETKCNDENICSWHKEVKTGEANCQFNSTKAKEKGVTVTQTQTGGDGTTPSDRCTRHKDKTSCEKENEGQKPGEKAKCGLF